MARLKVRTAAAARERDVPRQDIRSRPARLKDQAAEAARSPAASAAHGGRAISSASRYGLDAFAFFVANLQTGFGPFLAVYFSQAKWTQSDIGFALTVGSLVALSSCISVNAPDKPIVIELNINIKQEVIYRLADDVKKNIESNPEIF